MSGWDGVIDNWYDQALADGKGFKSEEEKKAYLDELGDPLDHPMFAETAEQIANHPLGDAFRLLREEDKTEYELVMMYKDEGNEFMKSKLNHDYKNAIDKYNESLSHVDAMEEERKEKEAACISTDKDAGAKLLEGEDDIEEIASPSIIKQEKESDSKEKQNGDDGSTVDIGKLRSQILSNKAFAHLGLKNYRTCITECDKALASWPSNMKAHFRKAKALYMLRKYHEVKTAYESAVVSAELSDVVNEGITLPADLELVFKNALNEIAKEETLRREKIQKKVQRSKDWIEVWEICQQSSVSIAFPQPRDNQQLQLKSVFPHYEKGLPKGVESIRWPMLFLYPQYSELDVVQAASPKDMLAAHLAAMFPELGDVQGGEAPVPWDILREYQVSKLVLYLALDSMKPVKSSDAWKGGLDLYYGETEGALEAAKKSAADNEKQSQKCGAYCEVHLGCTLQQVLVCHRHVTSGGLTTLLAFPRGNPAHRKFLKDSTKAGYDFFQLDPGAKKPKPKNL